MFTTLRVRDLVPVVISIFFLIGLLLYIPFADAETPDHLGLSTENDILELSLNDTYSDTTSFFHLSFMEFENGEESIKNNFSSIENKTKIELENTPNYPTQRGVYLVREGMPKNTRHLKEGYWIGALPELNNIQSIKDHGIKVILTVTSTKKSWNKVKQKIESLGIEHMVIPVGSKFPKDSSFYDHLLNYNPNEIFIHCDHGGDRSGTFIAYLLARREHWPIQRALLAMVSPNRVDVRELKRIFKQYHIEITEEDLFFTSIYSGSSNGGFGGLKVRNEGYQRLVTTMIDSFNSTRD